MMSLPPNIADLFDAVTVEISKIVEAIESDQWHLPTPCSLWDVSMLLNHMLYETVWVAPLLNGQTVEQVGSRFDGDLLGNDPKQAWQNGASETLPVVRQADLKAPVHLSAGDRRGAEYLAKVFSDLVIHSWDLAKATGYETKLKPDLVTAAWQILSKSIPAMVGSGGFAKPVKVNKNADRQTKLLALTGRQA